MSEEEIRYVVEEDGLVRIQEEGYVTESTIHDFKFTFAEPQEITEGVADKNRNKPTVSFTKKGRSAYAPGSVNYPDGTNSANMVLTNCVIQHTEALKAANHKYARNFVIIGIPEIYIDKIIADAKVESGINLAVKEKTQVMNGHYWCSCNLDKLTKANTRILLQKGSDDSDTISMDLDKMLIEFKQSINAFITFTLSASQVTKNMDEELDLADGQYYLTIKPTEVWAVSESDVQGPVLANTNARKNEGADITGHLFASGKMAEFAMKRLKISGKH